MRLIDADALDEAMTKFSDAMGEDMTHAIFYAHIAPTIDAVPVVRCKDCKHYDGYYCHNEWWGDGYGNYTPPIKDEDGFCDWAESKVSSNFE